MKINITQNVIKSYKKHNEAYDIKQNAKHAILHHPVKVLSNNIIVMWHHTISCPK